MLGNREDDVISAEHSKGRLKTCNFSFQTTFRHLSLMEIHIIRNSGRLLLRHYVESLYQVFLFVTACTAETDRKGWIGNFPCDRVGVGSEKAQFVVADIGILLRRTIAGLGHIGIASYANDFLSIKMDFFKIAFVQPNLSGI